METRMREEKVKRLKRKLRFNQFFCVEPIGLSSGLCLFWDDRVDIEILSFCLNYIHTSISGREINSPWECSFIYAPPTPANRRAYWSLLAQLQPFRDQPWALIGDFNEILDPSEKEGIRPPNSSSMLRFRNFVDSANLIDLELKGASFTWFSNPHQGQVTREKFDRVLLNNSWRTIHPHASVSARPAISSDHTPLLLEVEPSEKSGKSFKYEVLWDEHEDCQKVVGEGGWRAALISQKWPHSTFNKVTLLQQNQPTCDYNLALAAMIAWQIWKQRNDKTFRDSSPSPTITLLISRKNLKEYLEATQQVPHQNRNPGIALHRVAAHWKRPLDGTLKINSDVAWSEANRGGAISVIVRDHKGALLGGHAKRVLTYSPLVAEALAIREGATGERRLAEVDFIVQDIQTLVAGFLSSGFTWVRREGNKVAHHVATECARIGLPLNWTMHRPSWLTELLIEDVRASTLRDEGVDLPHQPP
ncbi:Endonuclease/exonuclease/phosphatase superfamily [Sesbania bispinosa]|nr:Endonuclease/exonuclease/phosphatase superfamily [Sesbania bispinosa]